MPNWPLSAITNSKSDTTVATRKNRRKTVGAKIGNITIGGDAPVRVQSMTTTKTNDVEASTAQTLSIAQAGAELVRLTAQGISQASALEAIHKNVRGAGCSVPLVADIHFNPAAAYEAAKHVEKVRINPGNFYDPGRTFRKMEFTDEEYAAELAKIREKFLDFLQHCRTHGTAIRIGVNHGSLSDRIMSRYGDGAEGMVESALEFLRVCSEADFNDVVVSIKASEVPVMTDTVRHLVERMAAEGMAYPLHLGVTEAGNALDGRVKSAVGIGSLLLDGIGDTIRVSLSEAPECEIPVACKLIEHIEACAADERFADPVAPTRSGRRYKNAPQIIPATEANIVAESGHRVADVRAQIAKLPADAPRNVLLRYPADMSADDVAIAASVDFGSLMLTAEISGLALDAPGMTADEIRTLLEAILQATGVARFKAEIVACPGCGRTLFELPEILERVKAACSSQRHLKIAVMGCVVNGPGEMAGADYGYVGAAVGKVSLYRGTECVEKNIPQAEALEHLIALIKADGQWID
ncbi:MAG: (E)-4-hydroxy-3-methylbut-2-enyl-diphosphate synthase [Bacteroidales bacterium]|nr:(E)-4-hydroxy-3-methylbut-2-enyl-diphosphate synthase [Bacteroidales bacterium]